MMQKFVTSDATANDNTFGYSVPVHCKYSLIGGAKWYDVIGITNDFGSAYIHLRSAATWSQKAKLTYQRRLLRLDNLIEWKF